MSCELWSVGAAAGAPLMLPIERIEAIEGVEGIDSLDSIDSIDSIEAAQAAGLSGGAPIPAGVPALAGSQKGPSGPTEHGCNRG